MSLLGLEACRRINAAASDNLCFPSYGAGLVTDPRRDQGESTAHTKQLS